MNFLKVRLGNTQQQYNTGVPPLDEYDQEEIKPAWGDDGDLPVWDFTAPGCETLECILLTKRELPSKFDVGKMWMIVTVQNRRTNEIVKIKCNAVLQDRLSLCVINMAYKIVCLGRPQGKNYQNYAVYKSKNYVPTASAPEQTGNNHHNQPTAQQQVPQQQVPQQQVPQQQVPQQQVPQQQVPKQQVPQQQVPQQQVPQQQVPKQQVPQQQVPKQQVPKQQVPKQQGNLGGDEGYEDAPF